MGQTFRPPGMVPPAGVLHMYPETLAPRCNDVPYDTGKNISYAK